MLYFKYDKKINLQVEMFWFCVEIHFSVQIHRFFWYDNLSRNPSYILKLSHEQVIKHNQKVLKCFMKWSTYILKHTSPNQTHMATAKFLFFFHLSRSRAEDMRCRWSVESRICSSILLFSRYSIFSLLSLFHTTYFDSLRAENMKT